VKLEGPRGAVYGYPYECDKTPMVIVAPGSFEALYWHNPNKSSQFSGFSLVTTFTAMSPEIITELKVDGISEPRLFNYQDVGCSVTSVDVPNGQVWIFENTCEGYFSHEVMSFELEGAAVAGSLKNSFQNMCQPGRTKRIDIEKLPDAEDYTAKVLESEEYQVIEEK
jgi:hypothetical protein